MAVEIFHSPFTAKTGVVLYSTTAGVSMTVVTQPIVIDPSKLSSNSYVVFISGDKS